MVAASDPEEMKRVRDGFLKKKLAFTESDSELDAAALDVITQMHGCAGQGSFDWLFACDRVGKLGLFHTLE